ncbi:MAG: hypothetical protein DYG98_27450 [Haliscomenobacteraceae bacterium CHB4]|nr:hypothetical protein [Haliscomenobacteraceae bacterium CHB4]
MQQQGSTQSQKLNETQLMLLKLFSRQMPPEQLQKLRLLLVEFYDDLVQEEIERLSKEKDLSQERLDALQHEHPKRTPYS